jgi:hypothetical protein
MPNTAASAPRPEAESDVFPQSTHDVPETHGRRHGDAHSYTRLREIEQQIATLRADQMEILAAIAADASGNLAPTDAAATLEVAADIGPETATVLGTVANSLPAHPMLHAALAHGDVTFERVVELLRLVELGHAHSADIGWMRTVAELRHLADVAESLANHGAPPTGPSTITVNARADTSRPATTSTGS